MVTAGCRGLRPLLSNHSTHPKGAALSSGFCQLTPPLLHPDKMGRKTGGNQGTWFKGTSGKWLTSLGSPPTGQHLGRGQSQLAGALASAAVGQLKSDGSGEETMDVGGQLISPAKKQKKRLLCFAIDLKMLSILASKQLLLSTSLVLVILRTEQRFCRQSSHKSQTTGFNLQGG